MHIFPTFPVDYTAKIGRFAAKLSPTKMEKQFSQNVVAKKRDSEATTTGIAIWNINAISSTCPFFRGYLFCWRGFEGHILAIALKLDRTLIHSHKFQERRLQRE